MINKEICAAYEELLYEYAEYGLSDANEGADEKYKEIEAHLCECEACRAELSELRRMLSELRESAVSVPTELRRGVMTKVSADAKRRRRGVWVRRIGGVAAAFVLAVGVYVAFVSGFMGRGFNGEFDAMAPNNESPLYSSQDKNDASGGNANVSDEDVIYGDMSDVEAENAPNAGGEDDNANADCDSPEDVPGDAPVTDPPENSEATDGDGLISKGEIPEKAEVYFENATAGSDFDGGIVFWLSGSDATEALVLIADTFDITLNENVAVVGMGHCEKLTSLLYDLESEMTDFDAVGYEINGNGGNECIVIFAP